MAIKMNLDAQPKIVMKLGNSIDFIGVATSTNYDDLENKPTINGVELVGNLTLEDIGIGTMSSEDIDNFFL